ncbi:MAG: DUF2807 domain-containing protein [Tannerella sp.]|jgi:hypothetical protein|nr:DUF2807 domain-containing protein [Tannerella sp.]
MKRTVITSFAAVVLAFMAGCISVNSNGGNTVTFGRDKTIVGNGIPGEKEIGKMDFQGINVRGAIDVFIADAADAPVKVAGDRNLLDSVDVYVTDGILNVHFRKNFGYTTKLGLRVTVPNNGKINSVSCSGSSDVTVEGCLVSDYTVEVLASGSSDFKGNIKALNCDLRFNGSSDFKGNVEAVNCDFRFSGSSDFKGNVEAKNCTIDCSGSSDFTVSGKSDVCEISMRGSSDFKGFDFAVNKLKSSSSGSSDIQVTCNEELKVSASGSSDVYYKGNAIVSEKHLSGSSDLRQR